MELGPKEILSVLGLIVLVVASYAIAKRKPNDAHTPDIRPHDPDDGSIPGPPDEPMPGPGP